MPTCRRCVRASAYPCAPCAGTRRCQRPSTPGRSRRPRLGRVPSRAPYAVMVLKTMPKKYGKWETIHRLHELWVKQGFWQRILRALGEKDLPGPATKKPNRCYRAGIMP